MTLPVKARVSAMFGAGPFDIPGDHYLVVPTGHAVTPDAAALDIVGDIHVRVEVFLPDWSPGVVLYFAAKYVDSGDQRSWAFGLWDTGELFFKWSTAGTLGTTTTHTTFGHRIPQGSRRIAVGVKFDVDNGASGNTATFETATSIGGTWSDFATVTASGTTSIFSSSAPLEVGNVDDGTFTALGEGDGRAFKMELRSSIAGTVVANPDFTAQALGTTSFADGTGKTWTLSGASIAGFDWTALPEDRPMSLVWNQGRSNELDWFTAQGATAVLRNNDRRYDPDYAAGPHAGNLLPRVPVRFQLSSDGGATWVDEFYGFVHDGWEQQYSKPFTSRCQLQLLDMLDVLDSYPLPDTAYDTAVARSGPLAFWKQDEESGTQMADSSGNGNHGVYENGEPADPLVFGGKHGRLVPHTGSNRGKFVGGTLPTGPPCSIEAWVKFPRDLTVTHKIVVIQRDHSLATAVFFHVQTSGGGSPNGELVIQFANLFIPGSYAARGDTRIDDDRIHHVAVTLASTAAADIKLYVDGRENTKTTISGTAGVTWESKLIWTVGNTISDAYTDTGLGGVIDEVAIYDKVLTPTEIADHYAAGVTAFDGEATGTRIGRVLDLVGIPTTLRDVATGDTTLGPFVPGGDSAGAYIAKVVESEQGVFHVAHHDGGKLKFRGRYARLTETRSVTSQATFSDSPGTLTPYREDIGPDPNGIATVVNVVDVSWRGGTETVVDTTSRDRYGPQARTLSTDAPSPVAARSAGYWLMARYSNPRTHIRRVPLGPGGGGVSLVAKVLGLRVSDRVTVVRHPAKVGAAQTDELIVEGVAHEMNADQSWLTTLVTSNADDTQVWIWGTSAWGVDTVWG